MYALKAIGTYSICLFKKDAAASSVRFPILFLDECIHIQSFLLFLLRLGIFVLYVCTVHIDSIDRGWCRIKVNVI